MSLIDEFYKVQELSKLLEELGHDEVILRILDDTSADRAGGKLYSSIDIGCAITGGMGNEKSPKMPSK